MLPWEKVFFSESCWHAGDWYFCYFYIFDNAQTLVIWKVVCYWFWITEGLYLTFVSNLYYFYNFVFISVRIQLGDKTMNFASFRDRDYEFWKLLRPRFNKILRLNKSCFDRNRVNGIYIGSRTESVSQILIPDYKPTPKNWYHNETLSENLLFW